MFRIVSCVVLGSALGVAGMALAGKHEDGERVRVIGAHEMQ